MNAIDTLMNVAILTFGPDGPGDGDFNGEWWWWVIRPLTFVLTILFIAFIVRFVVFGGFRRYGGPGGPGGGWRDREPEEVQPSPQSSTVETPRVETPGVQRARDILAERYARGEIDGEEYRGRLEQLR